MSTQNPASHADGFPGGKAEVMRDVLLGPPSPAGSWLPPEVEELQAMMPQYEILLLLGRGGMGAVYQARQLSLDRLVAIKILPKDLAGADATFAGRFEKEAMAMAKLSHPGIVAVHDYGETDNGLLYIIMEYVDGTDVQKLIATHKRLHTQHAMTIIAHVCDAIQYAHERGIIHRDIKPSNIMVRTDGTIKVADFGLAKFVQVGENNITLTHSGHALGTLHYMAPELSAANLIADRRADIYALGVMLYHMLTGKLPQGMFELPSLQVAGLDPRLDAVIAKTLREDRDLRYPKASDLRADLDRISTQPVVSVSVPGQASLPPLILADLTSPQRPDNHAEVPHPRKLPLRFLAVLILALALCAETWWFLKATSPKMSAGPDRQIPARKSESHGQWTPIVFQPGSRELGDLTATPEGVLKVHHALSLKKYGRNFAIRARLRRPAGVLFSGLQARTLGLKYIALYYGGTHAWLSHESTMTPPPSALQLLRLEGIHSPVDIKLAVVEDTAYGWVGERALEPAPFDDTVPEQGGLSLWSQNGEFSDIAYMELDGLSEEQALKAIGVEKP